MSLEAPTSNDSIVRLRHPEGLLPNTIVNVIQNFARKAGASSTEVRDLKFPQQVVVEKFNRERRIMRTVLTRIAIDTTSIPRDIRESVVAQLQEQLGFVLEEKPALKIYEPSEAQIPLREAI